MNTSPATIYRKITNLERELQRLKLEAYRVLPPRVRKEGPYSEEAISKAAAATRKNIWRTRYAKKITGIR